MKFVILGLGQQIIANRVYAITGTGKFSVPDQRIADSRRQLPTQACTLHRRVRQTIVIDDRLGDNLDISMPTVAGNVAHRLFYPCHRPLQKLQEAITGVKQYPGDATSTIFRKRPGDDFSNTPFQVLTAAG